MELHFKTLGVPELFVCRNDLRQPLRLRYRKAYAVLGYLAVERERWHERGRLAELFWPHLAADAARANLRLVLKSLNDVMAGTAGARSLRAERERVGLFCEPDFAADVLLFDDSTRAALRSCTTREGFECLARRSSAWLDRLEGEFLAGIDTDDGGDFEDWLMLSRAAIERGRSVFFGDYVDAARRCGATDEALRAAGAWVRCLPLDDGAARMQMTLLAELGRPAAALDAYTDFHRRVALLADGAPEATTTALHQSIAASMEASVPSRAAAVAVARPAGGCEVRRVVVLHVEGDVGDEAAALEPERHLGPMEAALDAALARWGGRRSPATGLALGAVFGLADDGEQAPRRAMSAALELAAAPALRHARIGVCEGRALISDTAGDPVAGSMLSALAQRLALSGEPGSVMTLAGLASEFGARARCEQLPPRRFRGLTGEYLLCRLSAAPADALKPARPQFSLPFVGRRAELARLEAALNEARDTGRVVVAEILGPAGAGKSRLLAELARRHAAAGGEVRWIGHRPELRHAALGALREDLLLSIGADGVEAWLEQHFPDRTQALAAPLHALLAPHGEGAGVSARTRVDTLQTLLLAPSRRSGQVLLVLDDLHWADEATRELLRQLLQAPPPMPTLAVLASRPPGVIQPHGLATTSILLQPLPETDSLALIAAVDAEDDIDEARRAELARMSGGLPLCAEYLARAARRQPVSDASLFGVLHGTLDRLGEHKRVLQAAAVLGGSFSGEALRTLLPGYDIRAALDLAESAAVVNCCGEDTYVFRHALLRDCAYESVPPQALREWHRAAAAWLQRQPKAAAADIAQHFEAAEAWGEARDAWRKAAEAAYLDEFAADARQAAIRALAAADKDRQRLSTADKAELELLAGYASLMAEGYGSSRAQSFFAPLVEAPAGELPDEILMRALTGLVAGIPQGHGDALTLLMRADALARQPVHRMMVDYGHGARLAWRGEFAATLRHLEATIRASERIPAREWLRYSADNPGLVCRALKGLTLTVSGPAAAARAALAEAEAAARDEGRVHGLCLALTIAAGGHAILDLPDETERLASEALALANERHYQLWQAYNTMFMFWVEARQKRLHLGAPARLVALRRELAAAWRLNPVTALWFTAVIMEMMEMWTLLDAVTGRALTTAEHGGDRYCIVDLMRLKALARHARGDSQGAHGWLQRAFATLRQQGSHGLLPRLRDTAERIGWADAATLAAVEGCGLD